MKLCKVSSQPRLIFSLQICLLFTLLALVIPNVSASETLDKPVKPIKIGLLIPDNKSLAAKQGAELAIRKANEKRGLNSHPFQLVVRTMEGPWGTGSKQAVDLIFEEEVWAIMGSHDGRNAHLVEQACTKTRVVFLSAWAGDPTLSQAFVPWYFSCVPNDLQQADALIDEIYERRKIEIVGLVSDNGYDAKLALNSFLKKVKASGRQEPLQFCYDNSAKDYNILLDRINLANVNAVVFFGQSSNSIGIIQLMRQRKMNQLIFGSLSLLDDNQISFTEMVQFEGVTLVSPEFWSGSGNRSFREEYYGTYGYMPGAVAAYAFDGMNIIVEAINNAGFDRNKLQESMASIQYEGVTGTIRFDKRGNRLGACHLMVIKKGIPVSNAP